MSWVRSVRKAPVRGSAYVPDTVKDFRRMGARAAAGHDACRQWPWAAHGVVASLRPPLQPGRTPVHSLPEPRRRGFAAKTLGRQSRTGGGTERISQDPDAPCFAVSCVWLTESTRKPVVAVEVVANGVQDWGPGLGSRTGVQDWGPGLGSRTGVQDWGPGLSRDITMVGAEV
jgi:hypothetical protein